MDARRCNLTVQAACTLREAASHVPEMNLFLDSNRGGGTARSGSASLPASVSGTPEHKRISAQPTLQSRIPVPRSLNTHLAAARGETDPTNAFTAGDDSLSFSSSRLQVEEEGPRSLPPPELDSIAPWSTERETPSSRVGSGASSPMSCPALSSTSCALTRSSRRLTRKAPLPCLPINKDALRPTRSVPDLNARPRPTGTVGGYAALSARQHSSVSSCTRVDRTPSPLPSVRSAQALPSSQRKPSGASVSSIAADAGLASLLKSLCAWEAHSVESTTSSAARGETRTLLMKTEKGGETGAGPLRGVHSAGASPRAAAEVCEHPRE